MVLEVMVELLVLVVNCCMVDQFLMVVLFQMVLDQTYSYICNNIMYLKHENDELVKLKEKFKKYKKNKN